jgi:endonuclease YncB( thermonuclease family)
MDAEVVWSPARTGWIASQKIAEQIPQPGEGGVTIANIGPDKYNGRVVADAATARTSDIAAAMVASGLARAYHGGHRESWCNSASR